MTLEVGGVAYSFEGVLVNSEITLENPAEYSGFDMVDGFARYSPTLHRNATVNLEIHVPDAKINRQVINDVLSRGARGNRGYRH